MLITEELVDMRRKAQIQAIDERVGVIVYDVYTLCFTKESLEIKQRLLGKIRELLRDVMKLDALHGESATYVLPGSYTEVDIEQMYEKLLSFAKEEGMKLKVFIDNGQVRTNM